MSDDSRRARELGLELALVARVSQETPLPDEVKNALEQRGALLAEVGTLRAERAFWQEEAARAWAKCVSATCNKETLMAERDAARAEVEQLHEEIDGCHEAVENVELYAEIERLKDEATDLATERENFLSRALAAEERLRAEIDQAPMKVAYLRLEKEMKRLDQLDSPTADLLRDAMDPIWYALREEERRELDRDREEEPGALREHASESCEHRLVGIAPSTTGACHDCGKHVELRRDGRLHIVGEHELDRDREERSSRPRAAKVERAVQLAVRAERQALVELVGNLPTTDRDARAALDGCAISPRGQGRVK